MSKSKGNTIGILDSPETVWQKLRPAVTDPARVTKRDPGTPEICNIYHLHREFSDEATVATVAHNCRTAGWGCLDCKRALADAMDSALAPIRHAALELGNRPEAVRDTLADGARRATAEARETLGEVRDRMGLLSPGTPVIRDDAARESRRPTPFEGHS